MRDGLFAQGYVHAQDRLWQLEIFRRLSRGRLCEMLGRGDGDAVLEIDKVSRTFGWGRLGDADWKHYEDSTGTVLRARV